VLGTLAQQINMIGIPWLTTGEELSADHIESLFVSRGSVALSAGS
jgi:hypothetical protein